MSRMDLTSLTIDAAKLRAAREKAGLSQQDVADAGVGVQKAAISKYELGNGLPSAEVLVRLCALYRVKITDLTSEEVAV